MPDVNNAHQILKQFDCLQRDASPPPKTSIQTALRTVAEQSDFQMIGVCAGNLSEGMSALKRYAAALEYSLPSDYDLTTVEGAVYIKFNPKAGSLYANPYPGEHRGVLVSCQSAYEDGLNEIYGHLPLDLFSDA